MQDIELFALGRNETEAKEMTRIIAFFLENTIPLRTMTLDSIEIKDWAFYIASSSEVGKLSQIPKKKLYLFDMHPNKEFFNRLKAIPQNKFVYVFNSHFAYINLLMEECRRRGVFHNFFPIAFMEQPFRDVKVLLSRAEYIIGVDRILGTQALFSERFRGLLRDDVKIIAGRRAASAVSAGNLLVGIARYYEKEMKNELKRIKDASKCGLNVELRSKSLFDRIYKIALKLANAKYLIRTSAGNNSYGDELFLYDDETKLTGDAKRDCRTIAARILDFSLLRQRLQVLTAGV
ncbi:MAG: hypothetical protein J6M62_08910 [Selenomonadaceae bacterium]|nr:hypothetical protein [Selenomonadaceae bacterium]